MQTVDKIVRTNYWLDPDGNLIDIGDGYAEHNYWAKEYLINNNLYTIEELRKAHAAPFEILHNMGWIRITVDSRLDQCVQIWGNCIDLTSIQYNTMQPLMNADQISTCRQLCRQWGIDYLKALNPTRLWGLLEKY